MFSKIKRLSLQEWAILILFIFSIFILIATVELSAADQREEAKDVPNLMVSEKGSVMVTYGADADH